MIGAGRPRAAVVTTVLAAALTVVLGLAGCGVPTSDSADRARPDDVPFDLLQSEPPAGSSDTPTGTPVEIYLYDSTTARLVRTVSTLDDPSVENVLRRLQDAAPAEDRALPSGNPLGDAEVIRSAELTRGVATVDLDESFRQLSGTSQLVALAEIVYTATARPGVGQVSFTIDGQAVDVTRSDGSLSAQPLTRRDYASVAPLG